MEFITLDFETANSKRDSPCEIGLTFVEGGQITETRSWLIKPKYRTFDYFNMLVHGIRPEHVADKPEFDELWNETIKPLVENKFIIAHNAGFDMSVLRKTLETYDIPFPSLNYSCSYIFSKQVWQSSPSYDLKTLCRMNGIDFTHHRAGEDSRATAELSLRAFALAGVNSMNDFSEKLRTSVGQLYEGGYKPSETKTRRNQKYIDVTKIIGDPAKHNVDSIFYGRVVVFTGTLSSMVRADAHQMIADIGGSLGSSVTKDTDYLIVGQQDYRVVGDEGMSKKQTSAIKQIDKGSMLEILSEDDFLKNLW